ncbi:MAG: hypothetical protein K0R38_7928 [Polyangiaceae bacterium]|nr:hypothetical protein [Polyangiaceae bacterium]
MIGVLMRREPAPLQDLVALVRIFVARRRVSPDDEDAVEHNDESPTRPAHRSSTLDAEVQDGQTPMAQFK